MPSRPSIPTRPSLLARLRAGDDVEGWQEFYGVYGDLLRRFALKRGLTEVEAEEVVQETAIGVARNLPGYRYDPAVCSFKSWLLRLAEWRIADAWRRRRPTRAAETRPPLASGEGRRRPAGAEETSWTPAIERVADAHPPDFGAEWDAEWERNLWRAALEGVRQVVDPHQFQIFDLYVLRELPAGEVAKRLRVSRARVYLVKQRISSRLKREMLRLEGEANQPPIDVDRDERNQRSD